MVGSWQQGGHLVLSGHPGTVSSSWVEAQDNPPRRHSSTSWLQATCIHLWIYSMMSVKCSSTFDVQWYVHSWGPCSGAAQWAHWWAGVCLKACALYQDYIFPQEPRRLTSKGTGEGWSDRITTFWCKKGATLHSDRCNAKELPSHFIRLQRWSSRGQLSTANTFFWFKKRRHFLRILFKLDLFKVVY